MSAGIQFLLDTFNRVEAAAERLGIDVKPALAALRSYLNGPFVFAIAGRPKTGRSRVASALMNVQPTSKTEKIDISQANSLGLWDAAVVVTPAEQALSRTEEDFIRSMKARGLPVAVVVSRADLLGSGEERTRAQAEIEGFRLRPILESLGVPWFFVRLEESLDDLLLFVKSALPTDPAEAHERTVLHILEQILNNSIVQLDSRVAIREQEKKRLGELESYLPYVTAHLQEVTNLLRLVVRDTIRVWDERVLEATLGVTKGTTAWVERGGIGNWEDVEEPLRTAWQQFVQDAPQACEIAHKKMTEEIQRVVTKLSEISQDLAVPEPNSMLMSDEWSGPRLIKVVSRLSIGDLNPLFEVVRKSAGVAKVETETDTQKGIGDRVKSTLSYFSDLPLSEKLQNLINENYEALVRTKINALLEVASVTVEDNARYDVKVFSTGMRDWIDAVKTTLVTRHSWGPAYGELLQLRALINEIRLNYGV